MPRASASVADRLARFCVVEEIVDTIHGDFQLRGAIIQGDQKLLGVRSEVVDLRGESVEVS